MEQYLKAQNECPLTGVEVVLMRTRPGVSGIQVFKDNFGSYRILYSIGGKFVAVMQVMSKDGKTGKIANAFTLPDYRRMGFYTKLIKRAKYIFGARLKHNEHLTELGKLAKDSLK